MVRRSHRLKLGHTRQEKDCKETIELQNLCATNGRKELYCGEHRRKLELFCQKDETFICVLCVPRHSNHRFVLVHEAVSLYKEKLNTALTSLESKVNMALMCLASKVKGLKYFQNKPGNRLIDIQEDAFSLEQYIKQAFAKLHQFLQGKKMKLVQQLTNKGHIAENLKDMEEKNKCNESKVTATQRTANNNVELLEQEPICLGEGDAFSLEQCIKQEFAKLLKSLLDKEHKLIQQLKNEEANFLNEMRVNLECSKHDDSASCMAVSNATLDPSHKESEILKEKSKSIESYITVTEETFHSNLEFRRQEPDGLLTVPETFEDVTITFSEEEWKMLNKHDKEIYREVMVNNYETMVSVGYSIPPMKLLLLLKEEDELPEGGEKKENSTEQNNNLEGKVHGYSISPVKLLQILKEEEDMPVGGLEGGNTIEQKDNLKGKVRGHSIPPMKLLKILKEEDELPIGDIRGGNTVEQKVNLKGKVQGNGHAERSASCIQQPSVGTSQVIYPAENLTQCTQPVKGYHKLHLSSVPQLNSGHNYSKRSETDISKKPYKCSECKKRFTRLSNLRHHHAIHTGEKPYKCTECDKGFACLGNLRKHYVIHTGDKPFKCTDCGKCFTRRSHLEYHQNCHKGLKPFKCPECNKCFADPRSVQKHYPIHTGEKPYKCTECGKCFTQKTHLKYHQNSHTGMKPYKCTECSKCFTHQSSVRKHLVIHTGEKPYKCTECSKCFTHPSGLRKHRVFHTGEKPYQCTECGKRFTQHSGLQKHCALFHMGELGKRPPSSSSSRNNRVNKKEFSGLLKYDTDTFNSI